MLDDTAKELAALAIYLDIEERISREGQSDGGEGNDDENEDDSIDGLADVHEELSDEERQALDISLKPVCLVLVKAS